MYGDLLLCPSGYLFSVSVEIQHDRQQSVVMIFDVMIIRYWDVSNWYLLYCMGQICHSGSLLDTEGLLQGHDLYQKSSHCHLPRLNLVQYSLTVQNCGL